MPAPYYGHPIMQQPHTLNPAMHAEPTITLTQEQFKQLTMQHKQVPDRKPRRDSSASQSSSGSTWFNQLKGDVKEVEICVFSLARKCRFEEAGCNALHAKCPIQWQFQSKQNWYNFPEFHSKQLEASFQKPETTQTNLSPINPVRLHEKVKGLVNYLGTEIWSANFEKMEITQGGQCLNIRQVSTRSAALSNSKMATVFEWYFKDECDRWIKFGQPNSLNKGDCVANITSADIETEFVKNKKSSMEFHSDSHKYIIDFQKMVQTNKLTNVSRPIRRRTKQRPIKGTQDVELAASEGDFPSYWSQMSSDDIFTEIQLFPNSTEYKTNEKLIKQSMPNCNILSIKRIQNPHLWNAFKNVKEYNEKKTKSGPIKESYLFHGTARSNI